RRRVAPHVSPAERAVPPAPRPAPLLQRDLRTDARGCDAQDAPRRGLHRVGHRVPGGARAVRLVLGDPGIPVLPAPAPRGLEQQERPGTAGVLRSRAPPARGAVALAPPVRAGPGGGAGAAAAARKGGG